MTAPAARARVTGTVYLLHFDQPYQHARHYVGNPDSSGFLKASCGTGGSELAELEGPPWIMGRSGQLQAGAVERPAR